MSKGVTACSCRRWEVAGWLLVALALWAFFEVFSLLTKDQPSLLPVGPLTFFGFVLFRGGIHLLKVERRGPGLSRLAGPATGQGRFRCAFAPHRRNDESTQGVQPDPDQDQAAAVGQQLQHSQEMAAIE